MHLFICNFLGQRNVIFVRDYDWKDWSRLDKLKLNLLVAREQLRHVELHTLVESALLRFHIHLVRLLF